MKKTILALFLLLFGLNSFSGDIGLPRELLALPQVQGRHLVCIWDKNAGSWLKSFEAYDHTGVYDFQVPEWDQWYWVGLWDESIGDYVFGKWVGHFPTE